MAHGTGLECCVEVLLGHTSCPAFRRRGFTTTSTWSCGGRRRLCNGSVEQSRSWHGSWCGQQRQWCVGAYGIWALPLPVPSVPSSSLPQDAWTGQRRALWDVADTALQGMKKDHAALEQEVSAGARRWLWGCG